MSAHVLIPSTRNVPTQLTRNLWEAVEAAVVHIQEDSEGSGDEGQDSLYWCEMCTYHICCNCVENGGHNSHKWKLTRRSMKEYDKLFMLND